MSRSLRREIEARAIMSGGVNVYAWSEPAVGKSWKVTPEPLDIGNVNLSADGTKAAFSGYSDDDYIHIYLATVPAQGQPGNAVQLTTDTVNHWNPSISPDGTQVAYVVSGTESGDQLCLISTAGGAPHCLSVAGFAPSWYGHPSWTPDGKIVVEAWDCYHDCLEGEIPDNIYLVNTDGTGLTRLTDNTGNWAYDEAPSVSSDGTMMAVTRWDDAVAHGEIYVINMSTKARTGPLTNGTATGGDSEDPLFVGNKIVYVSEQGSDSSFRLYVMNADGSNPTPITTDTSDNYFDYDYYGYYD